MTTDTDGSTIPATFIVVETPPGNNQVTGINSMRSSIRNITPYYRNSTKHRYYTATSFSSRAGYHNSPSIYSPIGVPYTDLVSFFNHRITSTEESLPGIPVTIPIKTSNSITNPTSHVTVSGTPTNNPVA